MLGSAELTGPADLTANGGSIGDSAAAKCALWMEGQEGGDGWEGEVGCGSRAGLQKCSLLLCPGIAPSYQAAFIHLSHPHIDMHLTLHAHVRQSVLLVEEPGPDFGFG